MMDSRDKRTRELLRRAVDGSDAGAERLVEAVPAMFADARRRRAAAAAPAAQLSCMGRVWLPRFAAVTALLVLVALAWPRQVESAAGTGDVSALNEWIVNGNSSSDLSDPVLGALVQ